MTDKRKSRKGENKSIRFEPAKYEFICSEEKLETPQEVVDFLVDKYWWEKKIGQNPIMERIAENNKPENKSRIEEERNIPHNIGANHQQPLNQDEVIDNSAKILELEEELKTVPDNTSLGKRRITYLKGQIAKLKNELK